MGIEKTYPKPSSRVKTKGMGDNLSQFLYPSSLFNTVEVFPNNGLVVGAITNRHCSTITQSCFSYFVLDSFN